MLEDDGLVVRYFLDDDEGSKVAHDAAPDPLDLTIDTVDGEPASVTDRNGHAGLTWSVAGVDGIASTPLANTKLMTLDGATVLTFEMVANVQGVTLQGSRFIDFGSFTPSLTLGSDEPNTVHLRVYENNEVAVWPVSFEALGRVVIHLVVNAALPELDRAKLYLDGVAVTPSVLDPGALTQPFNLANAEAFALGNRPSLPSARSFAGTLYYAAIYDVAFDQDRVVQHAKRLQDNDDS
jgi:hypothetical protein